MDWVSAHGQFINGGKVSDGKNFRIPPYSKDLGCYCLSVKEDAITIVSRDFEGRNLAEFTLEERKQLEDYRKKLQANQTTEADEKIILEIHLNRPKIITPKSPDCGDANSFSTRR